MTATFATVLRWLLALSLAFLAFVVYLNATSPLPAIALFTSATVTWPPTHALLSKFLDLTPLRTVALAIIAALVGFAHLAKLESDRKAIALGYASGADLNRATTLGLTTPQALAAHDAEEQRKEAAARAKVKAEAAEAEATCRSDIQCWGDKHVFKASIACAPFVERLSTFQHEWTAGLLDIKFPRFRWKNKGGGRITFIGDSIKFQNAFGAWQHHIYTCDYDPIANKVLAVDATPGRLQN